MSEDFDIIRVSQLKAGDRFEMSNMDYEVKEIKDGQVVYMKICLNWNGTRHPNGHLLTMGCKSQQFVTLVKPKPCGDSEKNQSKRKR